MLRQILRRGQITLPVTVLAKYGLKEKDYLEIEEGKNGILLKPVSVNDYSHDEIETLRKKLDHLPRGSGKVFQSASESKKHLDSLKNQQ